MIANQGLRVQITLPHAKERDIWIHAFELSLLVLYFVQLFYHLIQLHYNFFFPFFLQLFKSIQSGEAIKDPSSLTQFIMLAFAVSIPHPLLHLLFFFFFHQVKSNLKEKDKTD